MVKVWSYGGGKQSAAIAALVIRGKLPRPDYIVMSDTERERSSTFRYLDAVIAPALANVGLTVEIVRKSEFATVDLYSKNGSLLIPAWTTQSGERGKLPTYCSNEWKRRVVMRWMTAKGLRPVEMWLGISTDEADRMKDSDTSWLTHRYPLIDLYLNRNDCRVIIASMGWPEAPKSTCRMCPNLTDKQWAEIKADDPEDFALTAQMERDLREKNPHIWLHKSTQPIETVDFANSNQPELFDGCDSGMCWT